MPKLCGHELKARKHLALGPFDRRVGSTRKIRVTRSRWLTAVNVIALCQAVSPYIAISEFLASLLPVPFGWGAVKLCTPAPRFVTTPKLLALYHVVLAWHIKRVVKVFVPESPPLRLGCGRPLETFPSITLVCQKNLISLCQTGLEYFLTPTTFLVPGGLLRWCVEPYANCPPSRDGLGLFARQFSLSADELFVVYEQEQLPHNCCCCYRYRC